MTKNKKQKLITFITPRHLDDFFQDFCKNNEITPAIYLARENEFVADLKRAMGEFKKMQEDRVLRFKLLDKELDLFNPQEIYDEISKMKTKKEVVERLHSATEKIKLLLREDDHYWITNPKYNNQFFGGLFFNDSRPYMWEGYRRSEILKVFKKHFQLHGWDDPEPYEEFNPEDN